MGTAQGSNVKQGGAVLQIRISPSVEVMGKLLVFTKNQEKARKKAESCGDPSDPRAIPATQRQ